jgi:glucokinase
MKSEHRYLCCDLGGTWLKWAVISDGHLLRQGKISSLAHQELQHLLVALKEEALHFFPFAGVSFAAANLHPQTGDLVRPPNLPWKEANLPSLIKNIFQLDRVIWDNDANLSALGEWWARQENNTHAAEDLLCVTLGTGVGTGLILGNQLWRGKHFLSGEGGHIPLSFQSSSKEHPCGCGGESHLESLVGALALEKKWNLLFSLKLSFADYSRLWREWQDEKKELAIPLDYKGPNFYKEFEECLKQAAKDLAQGLAMMQNFLAFEVIVLTGGVTHLGETWFHIVEHEFQKLLYRPFQSFTRLQRGLLPYHESALWGGYALLTSKEADKKKDND